MFSLGHAHYNSDAIIYPFFLDALELRIPKDWDPNDGPPKLNPLNEKDGWIGLLGETKKYHGPSNPTIMPFSEYDGKGAYPMWLPSYRTAHTWRHFVAPSTRIRLVFPAFQNAWGYARPEFADTNEVSSRPAEEAFDLIATGPLHNDLEILWFVNGKNVTPDWQSPDNPYHARLKGLPAGLHVLTFEARIGDQVMLSRPASIFFHP